MAISQEKKQLIVDALNRKGANRPCGRCGNDNFELLGDGYFFTSYSEEFGTANLGGKGVPTVGVICTNCGNINHHAVGLLVPADQLK